jgi:hypothetical protein
MSSCPAKRLRQSFHTGFLRLDHTLSLAALTLLLRSLSLFAQSQPVVLWTYSIGYSTASPALAPDGTIYLFGDRGLTAITNNGSVAGIKWTFLNSPQQDWIPRPVNSTMSVGIDGTIYFVSWDGNLYAINPDGSQRWAYLGGGAGTPAVALDGTIYYDAGRLYALSPNGIPKWNFIAGDSSFSSSPAIGPDGTIFLTSWSANTLTAISPDGSLKWVIRLPNLDPAQGPAIGSDGTVFVTANYWPSGNLCAINSQGALLWSSSGDYPDFGPASAAIGADGAVFCTAWQAGCLSAFETNGIQRWSTLCYNFGTNTGPVTPAIDSTGNLYYTASNSIIALSSNGTVKWTIYDGSAPQVGGTSPVIGPDGTIFATLGSKLYAIAGTNALANSSWPMAGHDPRHTGSAERPYFKNPRPQSDGTFAFSFYGHLGRNYSVQTSTNLTTWTPLTNFPVTNIPMDVSDPSATDSPTRFYRAVSL